MLLKFMVLFFILGYVYTHNTKGSLTFVIDDTGSMYDDISQVKEKTNQVFDAVLNSNASIIDDFIIVTFNDPGAKFYTVTRDRAVFKKALSEISVGGGGDCPEYSMKGIELALEKSKPNSFFYVFTDAAAKDYYEYDRIKSLGLKKSIQVTFLLTGECYDSVPEGNAVYDKLSAATNGQVFHLDKQDVRKVIDYIIASIKHKKTTLAQKSIKEFQFSIDSKVWDVMISISGVNPLYHITGPDGNKVETTDFINTDKSRISKLNAKPGIYTIHLDSMGDFSTVITGSTSVCFQHGFSTIQPNTLSETSTKPIAGVPSYLAIALDNIDKDVTLDNIEIRDVDDNLISQFPLTLIHRNEQFYVTKPLSPPTSTFKIAINGHTKTNEKITRVASTTIEPQKPELEGPKPKAPTVTILEGAKITAQYDKELTLKCKVNAFPKPDIIWQDNFDNVYTSTVVPVDLPYDYMGILKIDKINKNIVFQCKAVNLMGEKSEQISVETKRPHFIDVLEFPKDTTIAYGESSEINLKVNAYPPVKIKWYKNDREIETNSDYELSSDGSRVIFKKMHQSLKGKYTVEAYNDDQKKKYDFKIDMSGEIPVIDKSISDYKALKGSDVIISCRILKGDPKPVISWTFKPDTLEAKTRFGEISDTLYLKNVGSENVGFYTCLAQNEIGRDSHVVELLVEYPPTIEKVKTQVKLPEGELVVLTCKVDGSPFPFVKWLFNGVEISSTGKYFYNDNSLSFAGSIGDSGIYTCEASNSVGQTEKDFYVNIYIPIRMVVPKDSKLELTVGDPMTLPCLAEGYPSPKFQWTYYSEDPKIKPRPLRPDSTGAVSIEHVQVEDEGFYRCTASNVGGLKSITYEVHVKVPVTILPNPLGVTTYNAVKGDLALRIPCKATGSPKPAVTWENNGYKIALGTDWYDIDEDGTLVIKYPTLHSAGSYICRASNDFSSDLKEFTVNVTPYPQIDHVSETLPLEIGTTQHVDCGLPHEEGDVVNWFKDGELVSSGELYLRNIKMSDSGVYSCRVSTFYSSQNSHKKITVGYKPTFNTEEDTDIDFIEGTFAYLDCSASGDPEPQINWKRNGNFIKSSDMGMVYIFEMKLDDIGNYECIVSNEFGSISRTFNIKSAEECLLDIEKDFNKQQPLLLSQSQEWPDFKRITNFVRIPKVTTFLLSCPGNFITYNEEKFGENVKAMCVDNSLFQIRDKIVDFSKLKCKEEIKSLAKSTRKSCLFGNTELMNVGFNLNKKFLGVYDVCIDKDNKIPLFAIHNLPQGITGTIIKNNLKFVGSKHLPFIFEDMYKCKAQLYNIYLLTGKDLSGPDDRCCFMKRQLVSPADVIPGLSQIATYNYLNVIPQWSSCGAENWDEIERRVQSLAKYSDMNIKVFTGASHPMTLPGQTKSSNVFLSDRFSRQQRVPKYIWKVVQNTKDKSALAIIQINIPNLTLSEAISYMPCRDICEKVKWMKNDQWYNVDKGFTFCCSITDFASEFGTLFNGYEKVFEALPLVSDLSLL